DVGTAGDDHVLAPVEQEQVSILVEIADVAEADEAVAGLGFRADIMEAGIVDPRRGHVDFASLARITGLAVLVHDAQFVSRVASTDRAFVAQPLDAGDRGAAISLGPAVAFEDAFRPQPFDPVFLQPDRARGCHVPYMTQAGEIVATAHLRAEMPDTVHHRWDKIDPLNPVTLDKRQLSLGIEAACLNDVRSREHMTYGEIERSVVVRRPHIYGATAWRRSEHRRRRIPTAQHVTHDDLRLTRASPACRGLPVAQVDIGQRFIGKFIVHQHARVSDLDAG